MEWKDLSEEAKSIIEWVVSPITNWKKTIEIKIGEIFHRDCPRFCGEVYGKSSSVDVLVTKKVYQEVLKYVSKQEDMQYEQSPGRLIFRLKDEVKV